MWFNVKLTANQSSNKSICKGFLSELPSKTYRGTLIKHTSNIIQTEQVVVPYLERYMFV